MSTEGEKVVAGLDKPLATLDLIAQALGLAREAGGGCLILGAGASVSAGIPTAAGMVALVRERFPETYRLATRDGAAPSYRRLLGWLSEGERARLIGDVLGQARLNWEHLIIAELMACGFIGPVLTVNFDRLLISACARANVQPAVYDLAGGSDVPAAAVADGPTAVYLHGLGDRSAPPVGAGERAAYRRRIEPLLRHVLYRGLPIVALGFRGDDPMVEILADHGRFANRLFWVGHYDHPPAPTVRKLLDTPGNDALFLPGFDAEGFSIGLARKLDIFPPRFIADPVGETLRVWSAIRPPRDAEAAAPLDAALATLAGGAMPTRAAAPPPPPPAKAEKTTPAPAPVVEKKAVAAPPAAPAPVAEEKAAAAPPAAAPRVPKAIETPPKAAAPAAPKPAPAPPSEPTTKPAAAPERKSERAPERKVERAPEHKIERKIERKAERAAGDDAPPPPRLRLVVGDYERLVADHAAGRITDDDSREAVAWAYVMLANDDARRAQALRGAKAEGLWARAMEKYAKAVEVDPRHADALYNWAGALATHAQGLDAAAAAEVWAAAIEKYEATLALRPRDAEALGDCARALVNRARLLDEDAAAPLIDAALDRLRAAYRLGDDTAYVGYLEVALAHGRRREIAEFLAAPPPKLAEPVRFALALVYLVVVLDQGRTPDLAAFDELPRLARAPCEDWDFDDIGPAVERLPDRAAAFVRATTDALQGVRPLTDWPSIRDAWLVGRNPPAEIPPGVTALR